MRSKTRRGAIVAAMLLVAVGVGADELAVVSTAPQGQLTGGEPGRVQVLFDRAMVPLSAAAVPGVAPDWLVVEPPLAARWRWAGTATLIGEPLAPLPRATAYRVTVSAGATAVDGARLAAPASFTFTTPRPTAAIEGGEEVWRGEGPTRVLHAADPIEVRFEQPVDAGALLARLTVRAFARGADGITGPVASEPEWLLETDAERPLELFRVRPLGCWPRGSTIEVVVRAGLAGLEGPEASAADVTARLDTPLPLAPVRFGGRASGDGAIDPEDATLVFTAPTSWRDVADAVTVREPGAQPRPVRPRPESWLWDWEQEELPLHLLQLEGGRTYEVCVGAGARDAEGGEQGFPWCGTLRTARRAPRFYLVEADGVLELDGPHVLPLRVQNIARYRLKHTRVDEDGLVAALQRPQRQALPLPAPEP